MEKVSVTIKGISPLLMHAFPMVELPKGHEKFEPARQAALAEYRNPDGKLYVPGVAMQRAMIAGATFVKGRGKATMQKPLAACLLVEPDWIIIDPQQYIIDSRPVVIAATKGRIIRHRPRFNEWNISFTATYDEGLISEKEIRETIDYSGSRVGILDFRPANKGPFGRFMVVSWKKE